VARGLLSRRCMKILALSICLVPAAVLACSLADRPPNAQPLSELDGGVPASQADAGGDVQRPSKPVLSEPNTRLIRGGCDGSGASCPELDLFTVKVAATDERTAAAQLRFVASFGSSAVDASAAPQTLLFDADFSDPGQIRAWLGQGKSRSETGFSRSMLCFTVAAVDEAGNVSDRSDALCADTVSETAATTTVVQGSPCGLLGCGCSSGAGSLALLALAAGLRLRRRR